MDSKEDSYDGSRVVAVVTLHSSAGAAGPGAAGEVLKGEKGAPSGFDPAAPDHHITRTLQGFVKTVTLQSGGNVTTSFGIGPGECKGDRPRSRRLYLAAVARGLQGGELAAASPYFEAPAATEPSSAPIAEPKGAGSRAAAAVAAGVPEGFIKTVVLQCGGPQATSCGTGPGEARRDRPRARDVHIARMAAAAAAAAAH
jgi:hypothetical protein